MKHKSLRNKLAYINRYFAKIPDSLVALETKNQILIDALKLYKPIISDINKAFGEKSGLIQEKCNNVVEVNLDLKNLENIALVLEGKTDIDIRDMNPLIVSCQKYALATSVEVESLFSMYKYIFSDRRQSLKFEKINY